VRLHSIEKARGGQRPSGAYRISPRPSAEQQQHSTAMSQSSIHAPVEMTCIHVSMNACGWLYLPHARLSFLLATQAILILTYHRDKLFFNNPHTSETGFNGSGVEFVVAIPYQVRTWSNSTRPRFDSALKQFLFCPFLMGFAFASEAGSAMKDLGETLCARSG